MDEYQRKEIKDLISLDQPVIIQAKYAKVSSEKEYITLREAYPYSQGKVGKYCLCDHVNIFQTDLIRIYGFKWPENIEEGTTVYAVCRPYTYLGKNNIIRGGLRLTNEINGNPIKLSAAEITSEEEAKTVNFFSFKDALYMKQALKRKKYRPIKVCVDKGMRHSKRKQKERNRKQQLVQRNASHVAELIRILESKEKAV